MESNTRALLPSPRREYNHVKNLSKTTRSNRMKFRLAARAPGKFPGKKTRQMSPEFLLKNFYQIFEGGSLVPHCSAGRSRAPPSPGGVGMLEKIRHLHISHNAPHLPPPPPKKKLDNLCFSFLLSITAVPREIENNAYAKFWEAIKMHYRRCTRLVMVRQGDEEVNERIKQNNIYLNKLPNISV